MRARRRHVRAIASLVRFALDAVLPRQCLKCNAIIGPGGQLCGDCWPKLTFVGEPQCVCCGQPFEFALAEHTLCAACQRRPPDFDHARTALLYDDESRDLILGFKHADKIEGAEVYAAWIDRVGAPFLAAADLVAPVPLHPRRLRQRRYNQAALMSHRMAAAHGVRSAVDLLIRKRYTRSQGGLSPAGRLRNVRGAFAVGPGWRAEVAGARVVLVDDVFTTGATLEACARVLRRAGARSIDVLALARVERPRHSD